MSELLNKIQSDIKAALKSKSEAELSALRLLKSDIQYEMTKSGAKDLADEEIQNLIKRAIKKRSEAIEQYKKAGREDSAAHEAQEAEVLKRYLPAEVSDDAILKAIDEVFAETFQAVKPGPSDAGKVMGKIMARFKGQNVNGAHVKELVQKRLTG